MLVKKFTQGFHKKSNLQCVILYDYHRPKENYLACQESALRGCSDKKSIYFKSFLQYCTVIQH